MKDHKSSIEYHAANTCLDTNWIHFSSFAYKNDSCIVQLLGLVPIDNIEKLR